MAKIIKAESLGFCMGVRRALEMINDEAEKRGHIETLGALVHNRQVMEKLASKGVKVINDSSEIEGEEIVISAHGVSPKVIDELSSRGLEVIDTTCAFVKRAQKSAERLNKNGYYTLVYGDAKHPEVKGILGWANEYGMAIMDAKDLCKLDPLPKKLGVVSQTTQIPAAFIDFVKNVLDLAFVQDCEIKIVDTLCHDIRRRQETTSRMASECELVYVIGGRNSANTKHLYDICVQRTRTYQIETADEINPDDLAGIETIGVAAGASTDDSCINDVIKTLQLMTGATVV